MIDSISERVLDAQRHAPRAAYAASYRANAACVREIARLHDAVIDGLAAWRNTDTTVVTAEAVVRRSPGRCLVQVGPVALTIAWLQAGQGSVADGELLIVVWRGEVATRTPRGFERSEDRAGARKAVAVWEEVLMVSAESEDRWGWAPKGDPATAVSSTVLADRCVERLRTAYAEGAVAP